ncbi:MFS general substrate transporter [Epithele typhae]|uniref:MFS general substrate transporter n=1 Tax=Epithele typhae TaxID=378194 RepID=UPI00200827FB|nr:MFS general substrate transporter [Epithele typhae]KAH9934443.1 MFS general substrate transporter [Epithele typhae]
MHPQVAGDSTVTAALVRESCKNSDVRSTVIAAPDERADKQTLPDTQTPILTAPLTFLLQICCFGYATSFGVYEDYYTRVYLSNVSSSTISWIGSINAFIMVSMGVFVGRLYDRGYFYQLIYGGALLLSFSLFMLSLAKPGQYYQILLSQGIGVGIGGGLIYLPSISIVSQYFQQNRAIAMTIVAAGSSVGSVVHPVMLNNTLDRLGFATAARANAGLVTGLLLIACPMMRLRFKPSIGGDAWADTWRAARKFSKDPAYIFGTFGVGTFIICYYFPEFYIQLDSQTHGLGSSFSFYALVILNGCSVLGRLSAGLIAQRFGVTWTVALFSFICVACTFGFIGLSSVTSVVVIGVIFGYFAGAYVALLGPFFAALADDVSEIGARLGIAFFFAGVGSLIGGPISGALLTSQNVWWKPAVFSGVVGLFGSGCYLVSAVLQSRSQTAQRKTAGSETKRSAEEKI